MPLFSEELSAMASAAAERARECVKKVPSAGEDDDSVEDALSALEDFVELSASKVRLLRLRSAVVHFSFAICFARDILLRKTSVVAY